MKRTPYYNLNKPDGTDYYNVDDFNDNADKIDTALNNQNVMIQQHQYHVLNQNNPHQVTKEQIGLGNVSNIPDAQKSVAYATNAGNASTVNGFTVAKSVPADAKFTDTVYSPATSSANGLMTSSDKNKLDGIASGAEVNVQTDWNVSDSSSDAFLKNKPTIPSSASDVGAIASTAKGAAGGVAELDSSGKVPSSQLPSYVDDVKEGYLNSTDGKFYEESTYTTEIPAEADKIYVDKATNKTYRWSGSAYVTVGTDLALGETSSTAYRGDRGKTAYDHSQLTSSNPHHVTASDVGLGNVGNFKAVSTVANQGLSETEKTNARANIGAGASSFSGSYNDLTDKPGVTSKTAMGFCPQLPNETSTKKFLRQDGSFAEPFIQYYQTSEPSNVKVGDVWIG